METLKLDVMLPVKTARGDDYPLQEGDELLRLRDLIYTSMGDDMPTQPGTPPPQAPADEKRRRWRISTQVMTCEGEWECSRADADYINERGAALLTTQAYGFLDMELTKAIAASLPPGAESGEPPSTDPE